MNKEKTSKVVSYIFVIVFIGLTFYWLVTGFSGFVESRKAQTINKLSQKEMYIGSYVKSNNYQVLGEIMEVNHRVNHIFKTGTDHYLLVSFGNPDELYVVIASNKQADKIIEGNSIEISGKFIQPKDRIQSELYKFLEQDDASEYFNYISPLYISTQVKENSAIKLAAGFISAILFIYIAMIIIYSTPTKEEMKNVNNKVNIITEDKPITLGQKILLSKPMLALLLVFLIALLCLIIFKSYVLFGTTGVYMPS